MAPKALYETRQKQVQQYIMDLIDDQKLVNGDRLPSEKEICERFGVSRITAQKAYSDLQKSKIVYRVQGGGTYVGTMSDTPSLPSSRYFSLIMGTMNPASRSMEIIRGVENFIQSQNLYITLHSPSSSEDGLQKTVDKLLADGVRSMIFMPYYSYSDENIYFQLINSGIHVVFIDIHSYNFNANLVSSDNLSGGYLAVKHLIEKGYRRIATVSTEREDALSLSERFRGYQYALKQNGLPFRPEYQCVITNQHKTSRETVLNELHDRLAAMFSLTEPPDAIFGMNDPLALDAMGIVQGLGRRVPEDVGIIGFDNMERSADAATPMSSIRQPYHDIGYAAAKLCYEITRNPTDMFTHISLPVTVIERKSTQRTG